MFPCANSDCKNTVSQADALCEECEKKVQQVEDVLDGTEREIIPGVWG
jgi:hypothetical protein